MQQYVFTTDGRLLYAIEAQPEHGDTCNLCGRCLHCLIEEAERQEVSLGPCYGLGTKSEHHFWVRRREGVTVEALPAAARAS